MISLLYDHYTILIKLNLEGFKASKLCKSFPTKCLCFADKLQKHGTSSASFAWLANKPFGTSQRVYYPTDAFPGWSQRLQKGVLCSVVPTEYASLYFTPLPKHVEGQPKHHLKQEANAKDQR